WRTSPLWRPPTVMATM
ncbi:putative PPE family protein PPE16, partial [Mycobacterium marinum]